MQAPGTKLEENFKTLKNIALAVLGVVLLLIQLTKCGLGIKFPYLAEASCPASLGPLFCELSVKLHAGI